MYEISDEAKQLHAESIVVDLHIDPIIQYFLFGYDVQTEHDASWTPAKRRWLFNFFMRTARRKSLHAPFFNHIDIPRMRKGGYTFGSFSIHHWPVQREGGWQATQRQLSYFQHLVASEDTLLPAHCPEDVRDAHAQNKMAAFAGIEGVHCLGKGGKRTEQQRLERLQTVRDRFGVRYITLTHFSKNDVATPCMGIGSNEVDGLGPFGEAFIERMNELGLIVDLAHVNNRGVLDACKVSRKPVIVSHTGAKGVNRHARNVSDEAMRAVAATRGLMGIIFTPTFLSSAEENPSSQIILQHIDYAVKMVGEEHVALGSDFDGWIPTLPEDMQDATDLPLLTHGMLKMGYSPDRIKKILGENFLRVWREVVAV